MILDYLARSELTRPLIGPYAQMRILSRLIANPQFFKQQGWKEFNDPSAQVGLLDGSLIQNPLYLHDSQGNFNEFGAAPGQWAAYDYNRAPVFGKQVGSYAQGKLISFPLREVIGNDKETLTPIGLLNYWDFKHAIQAERPSLDKLIRDGLVEPTTYAKAFDRLGYYENLARLLDSKGFADKLVYQVTPKGNTLVSLIQEEGKPTPKRILEPAMKPSYA